MIGNTWWDYHNENVEAAGEGHSSCHSTAFDDAKLFYYNQDLRSIKSNLIHESYFKVTIQAIILFCYLSYHKKSIRSNN